MEEEDKPLFVQRIMEALIECGAGRYNYLIGMPLKYEAGTDENGRHYEYVTCGHRRANVNIDSLPAMMADMYHQLSL